MPSPRKKSLKSPRKQPVSSTHDAPKQTPSRIVRVRALLRYILLVLTSVFLSSGFFILFSEHTIDRLRPVGKNVDEWYEVGGLVAWKGVELGFAWIMNMGARDLSTFIFLAHLPTFALQSWFYNISPETTLVSYSIIIISSVLPFLLLRKKPTSTFPNNNNNKQPSSPITLQDYPTTLYTTLVATSIFSVLLYSSYATWLPPKLVAHFANIPDISITHAGPAGWPILFASLLPAGWAIRDFLFASWARAAATTVDSEDKGENGAQAEGEYLICVLYRKTWGRLAAETRVLVSRTLALAGMVFTNTVVQIVGTVEGADLDGAVVWGGVWAVGCLVVGCVFGWIGAVDGEV